MVFDTKTSRTYRGTLQTGKENCMNCIRYIQSSNTMQKTIFIASLEIVNLSLYSNHPETIIKYFVTNLINKHEHSIRGGHLVYSYSECLHHHHKGITVVNKP